MEQNENIIEVHAPGAPLSSPGSRLSPLEELNNTYLATIKTFSPEKRSHKEQLITTMYHTLHTRLSQQTEWAYKEKQQAILRLKLARYFQRADACDVNTLYDAIYENPSFINTEKGGLHKLFDIHEQKTLQKIAEMRKKRANITEDAEYNPYEALLASSSGEYYLARLLNMHHLEKESEYMRHCVGTSDSYLNRMKSGEIEILSFRRTPWYNPLTKQLEGDVPFLTIEYHPKDCIITQIKKENDQYLTSADPYTSDFFAILGRLSTTHTDNGSPRMIATISSSELESFDVKPNHLLTDRGEINFHDIPPSDTPFILKAGAIPLTPDNVTHEDVSHLLRIFEKLIIPSDQIARTPDEIKRGTKTYVGELVHGIFDKIQEYGIEHVYTSFPEGRIRIEKDFEVVPMTLREFEKQIEQHNISSTDRSLHIQLSNYAKSMMQKIGTREHSALQRQETFSLVRLKVRDLGFPKDKYPTTDQIYKRIEKLGLELCPPETGPHYRFQYMDQPIDEALCIGMKPIVGRGGNPCVFGLVRYDGVFWLGDCWACPGDEWVPVDGFVFRLRKLKNLKT